MRRFSVYLLFFLFISGFTVPEPRGYLSDYAGVLSPEGKNAVNALCAKMKNEGTADYAVLIVKNIENGDIKGFAQAVFDKWKIGEKGKDNGLLMVVSVEDKKIRIQTGYGLEGVLPDGLVGGIIDSEILPGFKAGNYDEGVYRGSVALYKKLNPAGVIGKEAKKRRGKNDTVLFLLFAVFIILNFLLGRLFRRRRGYGVYGGFGGFGGGGGGGFGGGGFGGFAGGSSGGGGAGRGW